MSFEEKATWVGGAVSTVVATVYFIVVLSQLSTASAAEIAFQRPLVIAIIATVALSVVGMVVMAIATAVVATAEGRPVDDIDRTDERDSQIGRRGDLIGFYAGTAGVVGALVITMLEWDYFWIANLIYLSLVVSGLVSAVVKVVAYRRGF